MKTNKMMVLMLATAVVAMLAGCAIGPPYHGYGYPGPYGGAAVYPNVGAGIYNNAWGGTYMGTPYYPGGYPYGGLPYNLLYELRILADGFPHYVPVVPRVWIPEKGTWVTVAPCPPCPPPAAPAPQPLRPPATPTPPPTK